MMAACAASGVGGGGGVAEPDALTEVPVAEVLDEPEPASPLPPPALVRFSGAAASASAGVLLFIAKEPLLLFGERCSLV